MDIGSEIGTKMRSAVKAKLLELGTGDNAGYIDDELPDYIMIMIANKRSKSQMVSDLELFLGSKTTHFVIWLHEVLQKLQEVTIPTPIVKPVSGKKSKIVENKKADNKKDKRIKDVKKDKTKTHKSQVSSATSKIGDFNSINDVVAEHLLEKAKKDLDISSLNETHVKKGKEAKNSNNNVSSIGAKTDNSAATSEITSSTDISGSVATNSSNIVISGDRDKDLAELADIQRRIYAAKKHLREIGELDEQFESEDEDFLNLKEDESSQDFDVEDELSLSKQASVVEDNEAGSKKNSLNTFGSNENQSTSKQQQEQPENDIQTNASITLEKVNTKEIVENIVEKSPENKQINEIKEVEKDSQLVSNGQQTKKRPVHERLGLRNQSSNEEPEISRTRRTRLEKELYVPAFRRQEKESERKSERGRERVREPERSRERSREPERSRGERERERDARQRRTTNSPRYSNRQSIVNRRRSSSSNSTGTSHERDTQRHRIGSSVIIAANKPSVPSESEEEKPVNSVIKIKPRAPVSPSKQASKNLLMRAMADAQRSTILSKSSSKKEVKSNRVKERLGEKPSRERLKRAATSTSRSDTAGAALFRRTTRNLIIEVGASEKNRQKRSRYSNDNNQLEYVSNPRSDHSESDGEQTYGSTVFKSHRLAAYETIKTNYEDSEEMCNEDEADEGMPVNKTQFVVTMNDEKSSAKYCTHNNIRSRSNSPQPQVSSSSMSRRDRPRQTQSNVKSRLSGKATSSSSISPHGGAVRMSERESNNSTPINTSPTRGHRVEVYRKPSEVKKIIIQNDSDDDEYSPKKPTDSIERRSHKKSSTERENVQNQVRKRKLTPVKYRGEQHLVKQASEAINESPPVKRSSGSTEKNERDERERENSQERSRKISIRNTEARKYDNIPALSSVALDSAAIKVIKPKQLCKFHPNCSKSFCEYYHPKAPCKSFPNCKYGDKCMYSHPSCKYDLSCTNLNCNYQHSGPRNPSQLQPTAPPLSSHVVPVQNYKTISALNQTALPVDNARGSTCKYFPNCTKVGCTFIHPKLCRYGKNCINPTCNYYHHDAPSSSKFKWVASLV